MSQFHLILPNTCPQRDSYSHLALFFLMGPILGAEDWHWPMSDMLAKEWGECVIVNPTRYTEAHPHYKYRVQGSEPFPNQTLWERHYLRQAGIEWPKGCVICWAPCESKTQRRRDGRPYAMDTRGEIGEWREKLANKPSTRFAMGAEPDFPGLRTIQRNFDDALERSFKIHQTMRETVMAAIEVAKR